MAGNRNSLRSIWQTSQGEASAWFAEHPQAHWWFRILRLGLFQFGMGISLAPITGTLNRVLIHELALSAGFVALLMSIHYFVSPIRTLIGYQSDQHRLSGRWRTPYVVLGAMLTYGGLATAPFSLILFSPESQLQGPIAAIICVAIFLAYGIGVNIVETSYLALVGDITSDEERGKTFAILWLMLVMGTVFGSLIVGLALENYSHTKLIRVMQGSAVVFIVCTFLALFNQERLNPDGTLVNQMIRQARQSLGASLWQLWRSPALRSMFVIFFVATLGFGTHDVLLEPYGGEILGMSVQATTLLTALWGVAMIVAIVGAGMWLWRNGSSARLLIFGAFCGVCGFALVSMAGQWNTSTVFQLGIAVIGIGRGLFIVGSIATVMSLADRHHTGLFLGLWGVVQALAQGFGTIGGGVARDTITQRLQDPLLGYVSVYAGAGVLLACVIIYMLIGRIHRRFEAGEIRSPWSGLQDIPADQILY